MGLFSIFSPAETNVQSDFDRGLSALTEWHNYTTLNYPDSYSLTFQELQDQAGATTKYLAEGLGHAIAANEMSDSKVKKAMDLFADKCRGRIPAYTTSWFTALTNVTANPTFLDAAEYTAKQTAIDVGTGIESAGSTILTTAKSLQVILPLLVVGAVVFVVYRKARSI